MSKRHPIDELFGQGLANASAPVPEDMFARIAMTRQKSRRKRWLGWASLSSLGVGVLVLAWLAMGDSPELGYFPAEANGNGSTSAPLAIASPEQSVNILTEEAESTNTTASLIASNSNNRRSGTASAILGLAAASPELPLQSQSTSSTTQLTLSPNLATTEQFTANANDTDITLASEETEDELITRVSGPHQRVRMGVADALPSKIFGLNKRPELKLFANHAPRCADFAAPFFHFDVEAMAGPAYAHQTLLPKTDGSQSHLEQRTASETAAISTSAAIRIAATTSTGLSVRTGLAYAQINERFTHEVGRKMDVSTIFGSNGEIIGRDTVYNEAYQETFKNKLKFIEIPILLGYEQQVGKLRVGLNAGAYLNLVFDAKGTVFSPATEEPIAFGQEGELNRIPIFERRATAAWYGGLSLAYNLHSRYSLLAEPYFKSYPRALSSNSYDLAQHYWTSGIQVGLRMRL